MNYVLCLMYVLCVMHYVCVICFALCMCYLVSCMCCVLCMRWVKIWPAPPPRNRPLRRIIFARVVGVFWLIWWCSVFRVILFSGGLHFHQYLYGFFDRERQIFKLSYKNEYSENTAKFWFYPKVYNFMMSF